MTSYTDMARTNAPEMIPPAAIMADPDRAEQWFLSLPPATQELVKARLTAIVRDLPEALRLKLGTYMAALGEPNPVPIPLSGLGCACSGRAIQGLGQYGALMTGLMALGQAGIQVGSQYVLNQQAISAQKDMQSDALKANAKLQAASDAAAAEAQRLMVEAQLEAAKLAQTGLIEQSRISAPTMQRLATYGGIAAILLAAGGAYYFMRKRK